MCLVSSLSSPSPGNCSPWFTLSLGVHVVSLTLLSHTLSQLKGKKLKEKGLDVESMSWWDDLHSQLPALSRLGGELEQGWEMGLTGSQQTCWLPWAEAAEGFAAEAV